MGIPYDIFTSAFLSKVTEYELGCLDELQRNEVVDGYMKRAISAFRNVCRYDLSTTGDDSIREFAVEIKDGDLEEIADIVSEGMLVQWLKPYVFKQDSLELFLNTRDFTSYSPAQLLEKSVAAHKSASRAFTNMMREYSYNHGDLSDLHL
jgi:hypothetical protein